MAKPTITSADVAKLAGVSQSAVSRSFTQGASVSDETRRRVKLAANELGYYPNALARSLISGKSGIIGVIVSHLQSQFYPIVLEKLSRALQAKGYRVLMFMADQGDQDALVRDMLQYQVEGVVMTTANLSSRLSQQCADIGIPIVLFNRYVSSPPANSVTSDNYEGGRLVANFLADGGHQRISFIAGIEDSSTNRDRQTGFYNGLKEREKVCHSRAIGDFSQEGAAAAVNQLFDHAEKPDAIFVASDHMAITVMDVLRAGMGLKIPDDVSIAGFDDAPMASLKAYDLTTVRQLPDPLIKATVDILLEQINCVEMTPRAAVLPVKLIVRSSARTP